MGKGCGNPKCSVSTGVCNNLTFGSGRLSPNGYWSKPCELCRLAYIEQYGTTDTESEEWKARMKVSKT